MKILTSIKNSSKGFIIAMLRFPLTIVLLFVLTILNYLSIKNYNLTFNNYSLILSLSVFLSILSVMINERFFTKKLVLPILFLISLFLSFIYYILFLNHLIIGEEITVQTLLLLFNLFVLFLWIPSIRSEVEFSESFMATFKSIFICLFYSGIIMLGMALIYAAIDSLLFNLNSDIYIQTANIVFVLFAPIYFLSLLPSYPGKKIYKQSDLLAKELLVNLDNYTRPTKFLEILLSYIIIPLASVFTMILVIYIIINIGGSFWSDDLLELMLISYIVVVIIIYFLISKIKNKFTVIFRNVFPKILIFIVTFQTINSIIRIGVKGLTYGRYYVILFGFFAFLSALIFIFKPSKKHNQVALLLTILLTISLLPWLGAFDISKNSQISLLEKTLKDNGMLVDNKLVFNQEIDNKSKDRIRDSMAYLAKMNYLDHITFINDDFDYYQDFENNFGFPLYYQDDYINNSLNLYLDRDQIILISDYDFMLESDLHYDINRDNKSSNFQFVKDQQLYDVKINSAQGLITINDSKGQVMIEIPASTIIDKYQKYQGNNQEMTIEDAVIELENQNVKIKMVIKNLDSYDQGLVNNFYANAYLLIKIK